MSEQDIVIRAQGLGKRYQLGQGVDLTRNFREALMGLPRKLKRLATGGNRPAAAPMGAPAHGTASGTRAEAPDPETPPGTFWALRDVDFEIKRGEVVGIIGRNGAGKSTLLKVLSRITWPTKGRVEIKGRLASLLEVGTGFHSELSGRENIYLNGAILGMRKAEIDRKFDEIVDFAEVEQFLDTPVKRYSSGMYVRLAFAVAAHLEPEILIVDEVLAVGDATFQKKCLGRMNDVAKEGRTVLFVSHNMQAVSALTHDCILLTKGRLAMKGPTLTVLPHYTRQMQSATNEYTSAPRGTEANITHVHIETSLPGNVHRFGEPLRLVFEFQTSAPLTGAALSFQIINEHQNPIVHLLTQDSEIPMARQPGHYQVACDIPHARLWPGFYSLRVHFSEYRGGRKFDLLDGICPFEVMTDQVRDYYWEAGAATYVEDCTWQIEERPQAKAIASH